ncbi:hypothetical protein OAM67_00585 [bacterium]|nr:hypothetical protein [bacterium]
MSAAQRGEAAAGGEPRVRVPKPPKPSKLSRTSQTHHQPRKGWAKVGYDDSRGFSTVYVTKCVTQVHGAARTELCTVIVSVDETGREQLFVMSSHLKWAELPTYNRPKPMVNRSLHPCTRVTFECVRRTASGDCCAAPTTRGYFCDDCVRQVFGVEVRASTIPNGGQGLFAAMDLRRPKGQELFVAPYWATVLTNKTSRKLYAGRTACYLLQSTDGSLFFDGAELQGPAAKTNCVCEGYPQNTMLVQRDMESQLDSEAATPMWLALKTEFVAKGTELITSYNDDQWQKSMAVEQRRRQFWDQWRKRKHEKKANPKTPKPMQKPMQKRMQKPAQKPAQKPTQKSIASFFTVTKKKRT